ncbi:hypothetical protein [Granulicella tundricola]|uniref:Uncharacterized protein n=1 Tax=Granulicella tundricola (strain ATCC BAA-1859 / DSM 23138 / MP5ACTX9) TaxID=1198114 RepID=E8WVH4_GRATM|nr:hypothetical protein [Granulicella tundricola]ADW68422.1 hypothetical protein AciX9_1362 [Granulicella tundricola MP5ACTX9]
MSAPWPPPPDLHSIQELVRAADPEKHLAEGAPADEYEPEEQSIFEAIHHLSTADLLVPNILPPIEHIWTKSFSLNAEDLAERRPALLSLAKEIERFFGPESKPRTRAEIIASS